MDRQQVRTVHDWPPGQLGGPRVGLKHPLQWFVLQDAQGRWRRQGEKGSFGWRYYEINQRKKDIDIPKNEDFNNLTALRIPSACSKEITVMRRLVLRRYILCVRTRGWPCCPHY